MGDTAAALVIGALAATVTAFSLSMSEASTTTPDYGAKRFRPWDKHKVQMNLKQAKAIVDNTEELLGRRHHESDENWRKRIAENMQRIHNDDYLKAAALISERMEEKYAVTDKDLLENVLQVNYWTDVEAAEETLGGEVDLLRIHLHKHDMMIMEEAKWSKEVARAAITIEQAVLAVKDSVVALDVTKVLSSAVRLAEATTYALILFEQLVVDGKDFVAGINKLNEAISNVEGMHRTIKEACGKARVAFRQSFALPEKSSSSSLNSILEQRIFCLINGMVLIPSNKTYDPFWKHVECQKVRMQAGIQKLKEKKRPPKVYKRIAMHLEVARSLAVRLEMRDTYQHVRDLVHSLTDMKRLLVGKCGALEKVCKKVKEKVKVEILADRAIVTLK